MSGVVLTLRPPPNVDYVQGYPGIPPSQDRPQAAVKGAIEVRTPAAGIKAQWVRIELRKVETLPGGGDRNTFYDYVGPSPVTLWTAPDGFNVLRTQDFPFSIRIPESIPPSVALENRAGIQYELVATVCTKGKKGFLRKRKNIVTKEIAPIVIDKHELHSTWPVYCQPDKRQLAQEGVTLIVERRHACHGPGDRITVVATLRSDNPHTVILRGFEMTLKETTIFRAQTFTAVRKVAPLVRVANIGETKLAINATLYGGTTHQAELSCQLPHNHTTTTLNAARHIDVTYVLSVKALMGTGTHVSMDLPVIISNWQRYVSQEAIRRIGVTPALSLTPPTAQSVMSIEPTSPTRAQQPVTTTTLPTATHARTPSNGQFNTVAISKASGRPGTADASVAEEFGYGIGHRKPSQRQITNTKGYQIDSTTGRSTTTNTTNSISSNASTARRPNSARASNRYTITNAEPDLPEEQLSSKIPVNVVPPTRTTSVGTSQRVKPTVEEEKRVYESARSRVEKNQGVSASFAVPAPVMTSPAEQWLSAAEEKALLYDKAQAAVTQTQRQASDTIRSSAFDTGGGSNKSSASEMYRQAMANVNTSRNQPPLPHVSSLSNPSQKQPNSTTPKIPQYLTAEQEKAALKRYEEAKSAVDRLQSQPIAYDSLYPKPEGSSSSAPSSDAPPSFEASVSSISVGPMTAAQEKAALAERMRAADNQHITQFSPLPPPFNAATSPVSGSSSPLSQKEFMDAAAEKEALRKKLEARDASRKKSSSAMTVSSRNTSSTTGTRPTPIPPPMSTPISNANTVMSAAEEKALLKARLEAKDVKVSKKGSITHRQQALQQYSTATMLATETPPPLMPRPPAAYIQETQEEDERVSKIAIDGASLRFDTDGSEGSSMYTNGHVQGQGQSRVLRAPQSPPPLPPKPASE